LLAAAAQKRDQPLETIWLSAVPLVHQFRS
jgi:hypothetical protein